MKRAFGIDISPRSHTHFTWKSGIDFVVVGVSDGNAILTGSCVPSGIGYGGLLEEAQKAPVTGAYHYARSGVDPVVQLDKFFAAINGYEVDFYALDFETKNNVKSKAFAEAVEYMYNEMSVMAPTVLYSGRFIIQDWLFAYGKYWPRENPIWIAQYPYDEKANGPAEELLNVPTDLNWTPVLPAGCDWRIWQYSAGGNRRAAEMGLRGGVDVDCDVFNGTIEEMKAWAGVEIVVPPTPGPDVRLETINECIQALEEIK
jgi:hypothetical protein